MKKQFCVVYAIIIYEVIERTFAVLVEILREVGAVGAEEHGKLRKTQARIEIDMLLLEEQIHALGEGCLLLQLQFFGFRFNGLFSNGLRFGHRFRYVFGLRVHMWSILVGLGCLQMRRRLVEVVLGCIEVSLGIVSDGSTKYDFTALITTDWR